MQIAGALSRREDAPGLVLCSSARRTQQTLEPIRAALASRLRVQIERDLYLASAEALLARIAEIAEREPGALLIGHNPGLHELAVALASRGPRDELARLRAKLPTAALVVLELDAASWRDVEPGCGRLVELLLPRELE